jgi:hypothetical protein
MLWPRYLRRYCTVLVLDAGTYELTLSEEYDRLP